MPRPTQTRPLVRWGFWLLAVGWFCANSPQTATFHVFGWLSEARHFSHHQRLAAEVASILDGRPAPASEKIAAVPPAPAKPFAPSIPAEAILNKIDLALVVQPARVPPLLLIAALGESALPIPSAPVREPLGEPPRAA